MIQGNFFKHQDHYVYKHIRDSRGSKSMDIVWKYVKVPVYDSFFSLEEAVTRSVRLNSGG